MLPFAEQCYLKLKNRVVNYYYVPKIRRYYANTNSNTEIQEILEVMKKYGLVQYPYSWANLTKASSVEVCFDDVKKLPYVLLDDNKKLYFPKTMPKKSIQNMYLSFQIIEQHPKSPHLYLTDSFNVGEDDVVIDCGSAEGNFGLSVVDRVKKLYLFEADELWIEPLQATFEPWKAKVVIVQKYVSDTCDESSVSLDSFFENKEKPTFLKIDVEGYENKVLSGSDNLLQTSLKKAVICTYHYANDEAEFSELMRSYGYSITPSDGYMLTSGYDKFKPPYLRRGVIRCVKQ